MKSTLVGLNLLKHLANEGLKIFSLSQAREFAKTSGINPNYIPEALHHLLVGGWLIRLKKGTYAFSQQSGFNFPHEFEIAMVLASPSAISHWTAMHYHHLTQQTPNAVFAITPSAIPRLIDKTKYHFMKVKEVHFFGIEKVWINDAQIHMTDPEKTLLDGLKDPQYCGDFQEVLHAFKMHSQNINIKRIISYAFQFDEVTIIKRLGWILEKLNIKERPLRDLLQYPIKGYRKLNPNAPLSGPYNKKWMIQENIGSL